jgi:quercetin dioxygenase-like cupin family protein
MEDRHQIKKRVRPEQLGDLVSEMRSLVPKPGDDHHAIIMVRMTPDRAFRDRAILPHKHSEHVVLYYLLPTGPIEIEGELYQPELGEMLYMPPHTIHAVPEVNQLRISIALMVKQ